MLRIVMIVFGIFALIRLPRLQRLRSSDYPHVDRALFAAWHRAEKRAAAWLIAAGLGVTAVEFAAAFVVGLTIGASGGSDTDIEAAVFPIGVSAVLAFLGLLVVAAVYGSRAAKLKKAAGIPWPKKR